MTEARLPSKLQKGVGEEEEEDGLAWVGLRFQWERRHQLAVDLRNWAVSSLVVCQS